MRHPVLVRTSATAAACSGFPSRQYVSTHRASIATVTLDASYYGFSCNTRLNCDYGEHSEALSDKISPIPASYHGYAANLIAEPPLGGFGPAVRLRT